MSRDVTPVIRRRFTEEDHEAEVVRTIRDDVRFNRGIGDSGNRIQLIGHDCPYCSTPQMVRLWHVNPVDHDEVAYWCLNPGCPYFVRDELSYVNTPRIPKHPAVFDTSISCPDCGERRHTLTFPANYERMEKSEDGTPLSICDDCRERKRESRAEPA